MTKSEARKNRKRRRKLFLALIMILLLLATLGTATYAWFTANRTVTVETINVNVSTSQGLQISADATNWKSIVTNADIVGAGWTGVTNQIPSGSNTMAPVSTIGETVASSGFMNMYKGTIDTGTGGINILTAEQSVEAGGDDKDKGDFVVFDLFFQSSTQQNVYLTSNSKVLATGTDKGIQNAARVAFIDEGSVAFGSTAAQAQGLHGATLKLIWEPNYDVHTASGAQNANDVYHTPVNQTGASKLAYKGVKAPIAKAANIPLDSTSTTYFADVTTVGSVAAGIPTSTYINAFEVQEGVTKIRIYMWIEGQDVDCEDHASGSSLSYDLQFSIDPNAG